MDTHQASSHRAGHAGQDDRSRTGGVRASDLLRLVVVSVSLVLCILGSMLGAGVFGGPAVSEAAGGALSADATLLSPAGPAFSIWSLIYAGLALYAVWQWLPRQRTAALHRSIGWWVVASLLLNAAWLLVVRAGWLALSVLVIAALVLVVGVIVTRVADLGATSRADLVVTGGTFGLYAGWAAVATCANVTAWLVDSGVDPGRAVGEAVAVVVLVVVGAIALVLARRTHGNPGVALAVAWGLAWIAYGRLGDEPRSTTTGVAALVVAVAVLVATVPLGRSRALTNG